jgi:LacI family transcriptional regulator
VVTIRDVARAAGVSITTVSHTLNGTRRVSEQLQARVLKAMKELEYRPNVVARSLRVGHTGTIGLIIPDNSNPFFAEIARTIEDIGYQHGYSVILCNTDGEPGKQRRYIQTLVDKKVDGIIFMSSGDSDSDLGHLLDNRIEVVVVDREVPLARTDTVLLDNEAAGYEATRYLIELRSEWSATAAPCARQVWSLIPRMWSRAIFRSKAALRLPPICCVSCRAPARCFCAMT